MTRSLIIMCVALATLCHLNYVAPTGIEVIQTGLTDIGTVAKNILGGLITTIRSETDALDDLPGVSQVINLLTGLVPDVEQLLTLIKSTATDLLKGALQNMLNAVNAIKGAVLAVVPLLNAIVDAISGLIQDIVNLVNSLLSLAVNLLGGSSGKLDTIMKNVLTQVQNLGNILIETLGNVLAVQLKNIINAVGSIIGFLQANILSKLGELTKEVLVLVVGILARLLQADNLISALIQGILGHVLVLVIQLKGALQGLLTSILATLTGTLAQLANCVSCLGGGLLGRRRRAIE